jgi:DNA segregation ATPase FtsK/SpoIIIE, S-DNA-T family
MAKKRKSRKKPQAQKKSQDSAFWPSAAAVMMYVAAFFLLLGSFGYGGPLPVALFDGAYWLLGVVAYFTPVALAYYATHKFVSDDKRIPLNKLASMFALLVLSSAFFHVVFFRQDIYDMVEREGRGGFAGSVVGDLGLMMLDRVPASILFFVLAGLMFFLAFNISLQVLLGIGDLFKREPKKDNGSELASLKKSAEDDGFKMVEGVPIESKPTGKQPAGPRLTSFRNTAKKLTPEEDHEALTVATDEDWILPSLDLLDAKQEKADAGDVQGKADIIKSTFANFNIDVEMKTANIGPRVTQFALKPPHGVKLSKITALDNNLALDLSATSIRIEAPIPGQALVGVEAPNNRPATVKLRPLLQSDEWKRQKSPLSFVIGRSISGKPMFADLAKMPHLLVAGQTGSGKSVMINTIVASFLYRNSPADLKLIMIDPKRVELAFYEDIPHLLTPVMSEPEKSISALKWAVAEMERRYKTLEKNRKKNIADYNKLPDKENMPYIVVVIDELADLMLTAARDVEHLIARIAQKARAVGIHLVLATQRPDVTIITGLIKANVPGRIAFTTRNHIDSKTILDQTGSEKLLGMGDMLFHTAEMAKPVRIQGAFISDDEINKVMDTIRGQRPPDYDPDIVSQPVQVGGRGSNVMDFGGSNPDDDMYKEAVRAVIDSGKASTSYLQRKLRIGYSRASRIVDILEEKGIVGPADGNRPREILVSSVDDVFNDDDDDGYQDDYPAQEHEDQDSDPEEDGQY